MKKKYPFYKVMRNLFAPLFMFWFSPRIINASVIPTKGAAVVAGNHKHALDPVFVDVCTKRVVHTLAKKDLHDGIFGWFFRAIGSIPVDLKADKNKAALESAIRYLREGMLINVSPEAKRNYTKELLLPFKPGAVVMAKRCGCKVVPYSITGDYRFRSKNLTIRFGEPIEVQNLSVEEANELLFSKVRDLMLESKGEE